MGITVFENLPKKSHKWRSHLAHVSRQVTLIRTQNYGKCQNRKLQMRHFEQFSNIVGMVNGKYRCALILQLALKIKMWSRTSAFQVKTVSKKVHKIQFYCEFDDDKLVKNWYWCIAL